VNILAHWVICKLCEERFNRDKEECVAIEGRRYMHKTCFETYTNEKTQEEKNLIALETYIKELFQISTISAKIKKQIQSFKQKYNYTYSGMLKTLTWWFNIKQNSIEKANNGIGIIPYVYQDAQNYYYSLYLAEIQNMQITQEQLKMNIIEVEIEPPQVKRKEPKLFNLGV
jgi:hypothetical protein